MKNDIPPDWEPGHNIKWQSGSSRRERLMAAGLLLALAAMSFITICAALFAKTKGV